MSDLKQWAAVENDVVVHGGFDAPQEYIDDYTAEVVDRSDRVTPDWYHAGVEFVDVTGLDPRPTTGWTRGADGQWSPPVVPPPPPLTPEEIAAQEAAAAAEAQRVADDAFLATLVEKLRAGGALTQDERDRKDVIMLERGMV